MKGVIPYSIQVNGRLMDLSVPRVMGILNVTPDSFYAGSRKQTEKDIVERVEQLLDEGADIMDIGAYSSRPNAADVSPEEEMERLKKGLELIRRIAPDAVVSVDTFRASVARWCVEDYGVAMINDISAGELDERMFETVAGLGVPYIMMHMQGTPQNMQVAPHYDHLMQELITYFAQKIRYLRELGQKDILIDPGFGFGKTLDHNYELMNHLDRLKIFELPILVGVSRKSMIYKLLDITPDQSLNGSSVLHTVALLKGASLLRVHDVRACREVIRLVDKILG